MQETTTTTTMSRPQNPTNSTQESESIQTTHIQDPDNPSQSKKSKLEDGSVQISDEPASRWEVSKSTGEVEGTVATKSDGTVEDCGFNERERLKRHRVEVAGRVWIPDIWGQEDLLKDWIDCAAFDASLVNSSIVLARDSLMGERRRTNLRIHNGC